MWNLKFLVACLTFVTNTMILGTSATFPAIKDQILKPATRDELIRNMSKVTSSMQRNDHDGLDVCAPGVNRAILCEAVAQLMNLGSMPNENSPCMNGYAYNAVYKCKTANGLLLEMWSVGLENIIALAMDSKIVAKFHILEEKIQLLNPDFVHYSRFINWLRLADRSLNEIKLVLEEAKLTPLYKVAVQLIVRGINPPEQIDESMQGRKDGFNLCEPHVNRALLCQAINVRHYGETFWVQNSQCFEDTYFTCSMRTGEILLLRQGIFPDTVIVIDSTHTIHFEISTSIVKDSLTNGYFQQKTEIPYPEAEELAPSMFYPNQDTLPVHNHEERTRQ